VDTNKETLMCCEMSVEYFVPSACTRIRIS
jgi:hypothetical protein